MKPWADIALREAELHMRVRDWIDAATAREPVEPTELRTGGSSTGSQVAAVVSETLRTGNGRET